MQITFWGAAQTVTGSRHLIELNGHRLLLDCGLYQGRRKATYERNLNFPFPAESVDAVILSHAHIDHSGNLPNLVRQGYPHGIHSTRATRHLTEVMTRDSGHIQESDAKYLNKKRARKGDPPIEPLYTEADAVLASRQLVENALEVPFEPVPGGIARLREAGHILGSAGIDLTLQEGGQRVRLMFSGDIGRVDLPIIRDPVFPADVDYLVMECTYGNRLHDPPDMAYEGLLQIVRKTVSRGGNIVIPAFAVGRTQTLVYLLHQMMDRGDISPIKIFVDSPLAISVTEIFEKHPECFDEEARAFLEEDPHGSTLGFDRVTYTRTVAESKAINDFDEPAVIISASGMAEVGRILHHLKHNIGDPRNTILITSWMAPHTLGRRLVEGEERIKIFGETYSVKANVESLNGLSAHGDQAFLLEYARAVRGRVKRIFLVHGEPKPASALRELLEAEGFEVEYPEYGDRFEL